MKGSQARRRLERMKSAETGGRKGGREADLEDAGRKAPLHQKGQHRPGKERKKLYDRLVRKDEIFRVVEKETPPTKRGKRI